MQAGEMQDVTPLESPPQATNATAPAPTPKPPRWRKFLPWLGLLLLGWLISRFNLRGLGAAFTSVSTSAIATAAAMFSVNMLLKAFRWQRMLQAQDLHLPTKTAVAAFLASQFYGQVTLGRVGELYRAEALIERGVPLGLALSSSVYDSVLDLAAVLLVAATLSALVVGNMQAAFAAAFCMLLLVAAGLAVLRASWLATLAPVAKLRAFLDGRRGTRGLLGLLAQLLTGLGPLMRPAFLVEATLWTTAGWYLYFASLWQVADGLGITATRTALTAGASLGALSALLPVTISGLGAREAIYIQVLGLEHIDPNLAFALSILHLAVMTASVIFFGLIGLYARHRQSRPS
jgi:uncharacterized membrane protein YbhN (UPF0104 family)